MIHIEFVSIDHHVDISTTFNKRRKKEKKIIFSKNSFPKKLIINDSIRLTLTKNRFPFLSDLLSNFRSWNSFECKSKGKVKKRK